MARVYAAGTPERLFRQNSEDWLGRFDYREGPQRILQAYLQRIVNDGGRIHLMARVGKTPAAPCDIGESSTPQ